ncbi:GNAT family N-acetyltransferase [Robiginitalea sp. M366]|uniref:GNAT family N-acetyltransferase n=1 Tax=Robiginitalea aestuariiviva TaxID=3036903 RepID=UPI00240D9339|nr:GNAT family N-acetyltransferase [Robiginitalea aestuariiviva]MDG1573407.1 GNAT family N-acetyltransferase [Robiginitalea aestuariiviva]
MDPVQQEVRIVPYAPRYRQAFHDLNKAWIDQYFTMEPIDHQVLEHPATYILDPGGAIWVALVGETPVGVCALMPDHEAPATFELTKMGVDPAYQGLGIGYALGRAVLEGARQLGARRVYLESNTVLEPAIRLYHKLGFKAFQGRHSPYSRCNIQMEVQLAP